LEKSGNSFSGNKLKCEPKISIISYAKTEKINFVTTIAEIGRDHMYYITM
jgi:hypothetical protein